MAKAADLAVDDELLVEESPNAKRERAKLGQLQVGFFLGQGNSFDRTICWKTRRPLYFSYAYLV